MKRLILIMSIFLIGSVTHQAIAQKKGREEVFFKSNMHCINCEKAIHEHLRFEKGVKDLKVDHETNTIFIEFVLKRNSEKELVRSIEKIGYKAEKISREDYDKLVAE